MRFKGVWRDYQARVLDEMDGQLADGRLHIVAAPGAGKTVLGLEIVRRLGRRALVFAPTVAIRDQWAHRLTPLFLDDPPGPEELSHELASPAQMTLATYQALDAIRRADRIDQLIGSLNAAGSFTLVLDEAHHLRREWWTSLERLASSLHDVRIVALTATPPYDSSFAEWSRYEGLCGPIDLEIGAPELVRNGDLCPHQDHVILSEPTRDALKLLDARRQAISRIQGDLWGDAELLDALANHPWLRRPDLHVDPILEAPEMLSAILVLLTGAGLKPPAAPCKLLGVSPRRVPRPSFAWLEIFLDGVLTDHAETFDIGKTRMKVLRDRLHRHGLIEGGRVRLREARSIFQLMASNLAKLDSIAEIARAEARSLGDDLRMVILSDHVRASEFPPRPDSEFRPSKLGVVPIFEHLRREGVAPESLGVLTGTLVILPRAAIPRLTSLAATHGLDRESVRVFEIPACPDHMRVELSGKGGAGLVQCVTDLFTRGAIRILVGTQSLLGEGWDAPALNSLVLASNTASFMLSNQMRGRAIRAGADDPKKVANIWHLATVEPVVKALLSEPVARLNWGALVDSSPGFSDFGLLERRFRAFEGVSNGTSQAIENGIGRLRLNPAEDFRTANARTFAAAADRPAIAGRWSESLGLGGAHARVRETATPTYSPQRLAWSDTLRALTYSALSAGMFAVGDGLTSVDATESLGALCMTLATAGATASLPGLAKAGRLMWRNGSVEGSLEQVGQVVLEAFAHAGLVSEAEAERAHFTVRTQLEGGKDIIIMGLRRSTERQVMQAIAEVLGPIQNPRYLLVRRSRLGWRLRADYHAVPAAIGARKAWAEAFARSWVRRVGSSALVHTRTPEGRRVLLRARAKSLAAGFQRLVDRRSAWL